jgi:hypothetical protein
MRIKLVCFSKPVKVTENINDVSLLCHAIYYSREMFCDIDLMLYAYIESKKLTKALSFKFRWVCASIYYCKILCSVGPSGACIVKYFTAAIKPTS